MPNVSRGAYLVFVVSNLEVIRESPQKPFRSSFVRLTMEV